MSTSLGSLALAEAAKTAAGNWKKYETFCWHRAHVLEDAENWTVHYTHHRDSGLLAESNGAAIGKELEPFLEDDNADVMAETHNHWAVGWVAGFAVRVFRKKRITPAFRLLHDLAVKLEEYPVLDEQDYARREYESTLANIASAAWRLRSAFALPDGWESEVYEWLSENTPRAVENRDDLGGQPQERELEKAFAALGFMRQVNS